jgi:hypothetical protein
MFDLIDIELADGNLAKLSIDVGDENKFVFAVAEYDTYADSVWTHFAGRDYEEDVLGLDIVRIDACYQTSEGGFELEDTEFDYAEERTIKEWVTEAVEEAIEADKDVY